MSRKKRNWARTSTPCAGCGKVGRRIGDKCAACLGYEYAWHESAPILTGGRWVIDLRRRVLVWQEDAA